MPRARAARARAPALIAGDPEQRGAASDDLLEILDRVEIEPQRDAEARVQRRGEQPGARRGADQRERLDVELDGLGVRAVAGHDVDAKVLDRRVEASSTTALRRWISSMKRMSSRVELA